MSKGKFQNGKSKMSMKPLALLLAAVLLVGVSIGGTLAWLQATTQEVTNTFSPGNIGVTLEETEREYKMIPGHTMPKDPKAKVETGSEDCYLFVKVDEQGVAFNRDGEAMPSVYSFDDFLTYEIAEGWTELETGVYYRIFDSKDSENTNEMGRPYSILKDDQVKTQETVTKEMMADLAEYEVSPKLIFQAYAVQLYKNNTEKFEAAEAWELAKDMAALEPSETPAPSEDATT